VNLVRRLGCLLLLLSPALYAGPVAQAGSFEFHSDFWLNLHHFLYEQALSDSKRSLNLAADEKATWDKAVSFYRQNMTKHDLLMDRRMNDIDTELAEDETLPKLVVNGPDGALWDTLNSVAPVYRAHWWTDHDQSNRKFIAAAVPLVQHYGPTFIKQLTTVFETTWPKDPIRVDVSEYANWAGAYTYTYGWSRVHEIVSSFDDSNQGNAALEVVFHEATHGIVPSNSGRLADQISSASKTAGVHPPSDLFHIFIFYTAGELARRDLAIAYMPYAEKKHLYQDQWARWHSSIAVYWKQHIDGTLSFNDAVNKIVEEAGKKLGK